MREEKPNYKNIYIIYMSLYHAKSEFKDMTSIIPAVAKYMFKGENLRKLNKYCFTSK